MKKAIKWVPPFVTSKKIPKYLDLSRGNVSDVKISVFELRINVKPAVMTCQSSFMDVTYGEALRRH